MTPGLLTSFKPPTGAARLRVSLAAWAVPGPIREARHLQSAAILTHPGYHLVSMLAVTFHGRPAATWSFRWRPLLSAVAINVVDMIFTARTSAGSQQYIVSISAPAPRATWAGHIFRVALRTFRPTP